MPKSTPEEQRAPLKRWVALLRGVNVGGHRKLPMADLRALLGALGLRDARTYIQSGNAVFDAPSEEAPAALSARISHAIGARFGFAPEVVLIGAQELAETLAQNPFPEAEPRLVHFVFCAEDAPAPWASLDGLAAHGAPEERWQIVTPRCAALHLPHGMGKSQMAEKLPSLVRTPITIRNLRSVRAILDLALPNRETPC